MIPSFLGGDKLFYFIAEENDSYFIIVTNSGKSKHCSHFGNQVFLTGMHGSEKQAGTNVDEQHYGQFSFFFEYFTKGMIEARRHIPINKPYIISMMIFSHLFKQHATTFKSAVVLTSK